MEKETLFKNIFREYADDTRLPLFEHLFNTIDDEELTLRKLDTSLCDFATEKWIATHDDLSIGGFDDFYAWWKDIDLSEWHERLKSWMKKVMGKFYDEYDIERRFQEGGDPLSELKEYMSVLRDSVGFDTWAFLLYDDFLDPKDINYHILTGDAKWVYNDLLTRVESAKAAQH